MHASQPVGHGVAIAATFEPAFPVYRLRLPDSAERNPLLETAFRRLLDDPSTRRSHQFHGRFENIYPQREKMPEIDPLIRIVEEASRRILDVSVPLRTGFWFNLMNPGDVTTLHRHDDDDELLSAVYYLSVPANSGRLVFHSGESRLYLSPEPGTALLFPPDLAHEVERHRGEGARLSVAFNVGPARPGK